MSCEVSGGCSQAIGSREGRPTYGPRSSRSRAAGDRARPVPGDRRNTVGGGGLAHAHGARAAPVGRAAAPSPPGYTMTTGTDRTPRRTTGPNQPDCHRGQPSETPRLMILAELVDGLTSGSSADSAEKRSTAPLFEDLGQLTPT